MYIDRSGDFSGGAFSGGDFPPPAPRPSRTALILTVIAQLTPLFLLLGGILFALATV